MERIGSFIDDDERLTGAPGIQELGRKRTLVRPERQQLNADHPQYHYAQAAADPHSGVTVMPSSTGNEPIMSSYDMQELNEIDEYPDNLEEAQSGALMEEKQAPPVAPQRISPIMPGRERFNFWHFYCRALTFPILPFMMRPFGMKTKEAQMAWREKIGLLSIILVLMAIIGFITFGFTQTVCQAGSPRVRARMLNTDNVIVSGTVLTAGSYVHPKTDLFQSGTVLYPPVNSGGKDLSMLFQNVNGRCLDIITPKDGTKVPTDGNRVAWYFPCQVVAKDGSWEDPKNYTQISVGNIYDGFACHTSNSARDTLYDSHNLTASIYYTWDDIFDDNRQLIIYNGDVLNMEFVSHLLKDDLDYPEIFDTLANGKEYRHKDVSQMFSTGQNRRHLECLREITKVGALDTEEIGCIASSVVLYLSMVFIIGLCVIKVLFACYHHFVITPKRGAFPVSVKEMAEHEQEVENWTENPYKQAALPDRPTAVANKRKSVLSRKLGAKSSPDKRKSVTMVTQHPVLTNSKVIPSHSSINLAGNRSSMFAPSMMTRPKSAYNRNSMMLDSDTSYKRHSMPFGAEDDARDFNSGTLAGSSTNLTVGGSAYRSPSPMAAHTRNQSRASQSHSEGGSFGTQSPEPRSDPFYGEYRGEEEDEVHDLSQSPIMGPIGGEDEYWVPQPPVEYEPFGYPLAHVMCLVTAYSEDEQGLRTTLDSIATTEYPNSHKLITVICDGLIKGHGNDLTTPEICLSMMYDFVTPPEEVQAYSYVSVVTGAKRHNMAKVYAGFYRYNDETIPVEQQQRVPVILIVKCGTPAEANEAKPGNRGKRDTQIILMTFLQRVMFDERMTELDFEIFNGICNITGIAPDYYEMVLMVDADTKVYPDSMTHMIADMVRDPEIMGLCGETKIANKTQSWVTAIQVFEYFISHHMAKAFESTFGNVTCLPGCFSIYRIKSPKGQDGYWVPILANPDIVERYSANVVETLHEKNLLLLGEDRYLSTLMLRTFPRRKNVFLPRAACKTIAPDSFKVLLSQRRRWINSTIHNLFELLLVHDLCGVFIFSMQFVIIMDLISTLVLPAAIVFTLYVVVKAGQDFHQAYLSLILLIVILGLPGVLILVTASNPMYFVWMLVYLLALPIWNFVLPLYSYWKFDDFSWGDTRKISGGDKGGHGSAVGEFDSSQIIMKRWREFQREREIY